MKLELLGTLPFIVWLFPAIAIGGVPCTGHVSTLAIGPTSGTLQVNTGYGVHYLCKFQETINGVHPEICKAWYSMFLTAKASGKQVAQYYPNGTTCSASYLGNWQVPSQFPYFVSLVD